MTQAQNRPSEEGLVLNSKEIPVLQEAVLMLTNLSSILLGRLIPPVYDQMLTNLQRIRPLLVRFNQPCRDHNISSPIEAIDRLAMKQASTPTACIELAHLCIKSTLLMQRALSIAYVKMAQAPAKDIVVDYTQLKNPN